eukprot:TRINITY_DN70511_c0_g1_i1.p1 TRINITY_DN70511_c0_g1~~TRINITY_DN70511_c0_g1_i1.p1  ORF type:complete len:212 (+),score=15.46 TRINITY_DN70511_c0_g1_i1:89-724(+)
MPHFKTHGARRYNPKAQDRSNYPVTIHRVGNKVIRSVTVNNRATNNAKSGTKNQSSLTSYGVILFRTTPQGSQFLLTSYHTSESGVWCIPKGPKTDNETESNAALRHLSEKMGIDASRVTLDDTFRHVVHYKPHYQRFQNKRIQKTLVIFFGLLERNGPISSEIYHYKWQKYTAGTKVFNFVIDSTLRHLESFSDTPIAGSEETKDGSDTD